MNCINLTLLEDGKYYDGRLYNDDSGVLIFIAYDASTLLSISKMVNQFVKKRISY